MGIDSQSCLEMGQPEGLELLQLHSAKRQANISSKERSSEPLANLSLVDTGSQLQEKVGVFDAEYCGGEEAMGRLELAVRSLVDIEEMIKEMKTNGKTKVTELQKQVNTMKPEMKAAKMKYKAFRKALRKSFKSCRKAGKANKRTWKGAQVCQAFKDHFFTQKEKEDNPKCARKPKCELKEARLKAKRAAKDKYKAVRKNFREVKKELRKAKFETNVLPKIIKLLKPWLLKAMKKTDLGALTGGLTPCVGEITANCTPIKGIGIDLLKSYVTNQLAAFLGPKIGSLMGDIQNVIWNFIDPFFSSIKSALVSAVGSIPFVGGALASVVSTLMETIYILIKKGVASAFGLIQTALQSGVIEEIAKKLFGSGGVFSPATLKNPPADQGAQMRAAADGGSNLVLSSTQSRMNLEAAKGEAQAEKEAKGADSSIKSAGETVQNEEEADDKAEDDEDEAEESADLQSEEGDEDDGGGGGGGGGGRRRRRRPAAPPPAPPPPPPPPPAPPPPPPPKKRRRRKR